MTQQPNQNYPQPGGWGQQQPAQQPGGWGQQQPAQQGGQWGGAQQPQYGQAQPAQQQYGAGAAYSGGTTSGGGTTWGKIWGFYAAGGLAVVAAVGVFLAWASIKLTPPASEAAALGGKSITITINAIAKGSSSAGNSGTAKDITAIWGWLLLVTAVVAVVGVVLVVVMKTAIAGWVTVGGSGGALLFAVIAAIYFNGKVSDAKKAYTGPDAGLPAGTKYEIGLGIGAYLALGAALIAVVLAVLAQLSINSGGAAASATPAYNQQAYQQPGQQGYQQPAGYAQPGQQGYQAPQPGQQAQQPQQGGWGQPQPGQQAPQPGQQPGQQQWGNPQPPQQGQQQWGGYDPAANQPTQAVQPGYMPGQQPPPQQ
ncbi:hypothetical protein [Catenulispora rubra]|uniref:hypothetical protein n=1 Tax=Catenulispora rubra TaxID=280293 RepID=UPI0018925E62|nr:hypothetical protein [Catenulispora rubra]